MQPVNFSHLIEHNAGSSILSFDRIWRDPEPISEKYTLYLSPDSNTYYSRINPVFSFQLEDSNLRYFNVLSLRDGVYPLLRFFAMNENPHLADCVLVIDLALAPLVPKKWRDKVFLRELYVEAPVFEKDLNECVILISPDRDSLPMDLFEKEIEKCRSKLANYKKISIYFSSCAARGEEENKFNTNWGYSLLTAFIKYFPDKEIETLDWGHYQRKNIAQCSFLFINPLKLYFADSCLLHDLLQRGAMPLVDAFNPEDGGHKEKISINHGYKITPWAGPEESLSEEGLSKIFKDQEIAVKPVGDDFTYVKLTNSGFKDFSIDLARQIYNT